MEPNSSEIFVSTVSPVPWHIGLRPIGEHLLFFPASILTRSHWFLDWIHPGGGEERVEVSV